MDRSPPDQTLARSPPFKARAFHFLRKLALPRGWKNGRKPKDTISPVAIPTQDFQRAHSSVDLVRKPDVSHFIGFRAEGGSNPMDTDDSSQDASPSGNSSPLRPRRHSAWDSLCTAPIHSTFPGRDAVSPFLRDQAGLGGRAFLSDPMKLETPAPAVSQSTTSLEQPARSALTNPEIAAHFDVALEAMTYVETVHDTPTNDTPRLSKDVYPHDDSRMSPLSGPSPSTSSDTSAFSETQSLRATEDPTPKSIPSRPPLVPRHSAPLPPPFCVTTERGLRLSPSVITRQPMPLLHLPALPPPPPVQDPPPRRTVPLRSMPSLSRHGHSNIECLADHETATLEDSEEDDVDECDEEEFMDASSDHQSDEEDDELPSAGPSNQGVRISQKRPLRDDESVTESPITPMSPQSDNDAPGLNLVDCSCSKAYVEPVRVAPSSTSLEMYPFSSNIPIVEEIARRHSPDPDLPIPRTSRLENRPALHRIASQSMINLGSTRRSEWTGRSKGGVESNATSASGHTSESLEELEESDTESIIGRLLRRTSMPSFHPTSDPPPYPTFNPRPKEARVLPREDEGRERLPPYSNYLYLIAIMPRKMEFSSPGVQAKDRKWRRVVCELEGTTFRVYKSPPGASGAGVFGDWWEKHVGVGDVAGPNPPRSRTKTSEEPFERPPKLGIEDPPPPATPTEPSSQSTSVSPVRQRTSSQSSMTTQNTFTPRPTKRMSAASFLSPFRSSSIARAESSAGETSRLRQPHELELLPVDMQESRSSLSHESTGRATPVTQRMSQPPQPRSASRLTFLSTGRSPAWRNGEIPKPPESDLLRAYTLQHAESGLGNDYLKRKNVIRVRLEGEQFLLQAPDVPAVVEWIEGIHAGTNISLDIDQRPMPRGPMFPRRRRRRAPRTRGEDGSGERPSGSQVHV